MSASEFWQRSHDALHVASTGEPVTVIRVETKHVAGRRDASGNVVFDVWESFAGLPYDKQNRTIGTKP